MDRRSFVAFTGAAALFGMVYPLRLNSEGNGMYGLIGRMAAVPGKRDALAAILLESSNNMPGCRSYIVARDRDDADSLWVTEVWDSEEHHRASLKLPAVQAAIAKAKPLIAGFGDRHTTEPVGGHGLAAG